MRHRTRFPCAATLFAACLALLALPHAVSAQAVAAAPERVVFPRGSASVTLQGVVGGTTPTRDYVLRAAEGQRMRVWRHSSYGGHVEILAPGLRDAGERGRWPIGATVGTSPWEERLLESGDYVLRVVPESARRIPYTITVAIEGAPDRSHTRAMPVGTYTRLDDLNHGHIEFGAFVMGALSFQLEALARIAVPDESDALHFGEASGVLHPRGRVATWRSGACELVLRMGPERVFVEQRGSDVDCGFGANVSAAGTYAWEPRGVSADTEEQLSRARRAAR